MLSRDEIALVTAPTLGPWSTLANPTATIRRMLRVTRTVYFTPAELIGESVPQHLASLVRLRHLYALDVTVTGQPDAQSGFLTNVREIDRRVREWALPQAAKIISGERTDWPRGERLVLLLWDALRHKNDGTASVDGCPLVRLQLTESPFIWCAYEGNSKRMVYLTRRFDFNSAHRLHNPKLSADENREVFGKCNNPSGHGHNYVLEVTVAGEPTDEGSLVQVDDLAEVVERRVVDQLDHKHLNVDVPEFKNVNSTVENIAVVIWKMLEGHVPRPARLHSVKIWETPKTYSEYFGENKS